MDPLKDQVNMQMLSKLTANFYVTHNNYYYFFICLGMERKLANWNLNKLYALSHFSLVLPLSLFVFCWQSADFRLE